MNACFKRPLMWLQDMNPFRFCCISLLLQTRFLVSPAPCPSLSQSHNHSLSSSSLHVPKLFGVLRRFRRQCFACCHRGRACGEDRRLRSQRRCSWPPWRVSERRGTRPAGTIGTG
nr:hypothetical protein Iba_scaffold17299CG0010 [Ipomoea batatas]